MAHDVFVSYASGDKAVADAVCATLESHGIRCWIAPRDVLPGLHYGEAIIDAIHDCRIMVLVFSSKANLSGHIPKEIERAVSQGATIMPLRIEDVLPAKSLDYFIGSIHWLDAITPPLEAHLQRLAANVKTLLARNASPPPPASPAPTVSSAATPPSVPGHSAVPAARPKWTYAVIGTLALVILVLGFFMVRSNSEIPSSSPAPASPSETQSAARPAAISPPVAGPAPVPAGSRAPKKTITVENAEATTAAPVATIAAKAKPVADHGHTLVFHEGTGGTTKLEQLIGDQDKERKQPTRNQTQSRFGVEGAEVGTSFEHNGHAYFLFADVVGIMPRWLDAIAMTDASDPDAGVSLDFLSTEKGRYLAIEPTGLFMGINAIPVAGISLGDQMYVVVRTHDQRDLTTEHTVLTKFIPPSTFQPVHTISTLPAGRFLKMSLHTLQGNQDGLPPGGPFIAMWGTGAYRESDAYMAVTPVSQIESGRGTRYFAGQNESGSPVWSAKESDAKPIVKDGTLGDLSVTWCKDLGLWIMTYDRRSAPNGIVFSYSRTPWGPWSEPQLLFNAQLDGALGKFIHAPRGKPPDGLEGPVLLTRKQVDPETVHGAAYAPYVIERWTKVRGSELDLYYTMSTGNPYVVVLMKSKIQVQ